MAGQQLDGGRDGPDGAGGEGDIRALSGRLRADRPLQEPGLGAFGAGLAVQRLSVLLDPDVGPAQRRLRRRPGFGVHNVVVCDIDVVFKRLIAVDASEMGLRRCSHEPAQQQRLLRVRRVSGDFRDKRVQSGVGIVGLCFIRHVGPPYGVNPASRVLFGGMVIGQARAFHPAARNVQHSSMNFQTAALRVNGAKRGSIVGRGDVL